MNTNRSISLRISDHRRLYAARVGRRRLVYLDHNIWIELRDATTQGAVDCLEACRDAVAARGVLFPLALPAVTEAIEIRDRTTRLKHADLLDELSQGITFRSPVVLMRKEAELAYRWLFRGEQGVLPREECLTLVPGHLGEEAWTFPSGTPPEVIARFAHFIANEAPLRTVRYIAEQRDWGADHADLRERFVREMIVMRERRLAATPQPKAAAFAEALRRERLALTNDYIIPACRDALLADVGPEGAAAAFEAFFARKGEGGERRLRAMFVRLPLLDQHARLMALDAMETSRRPQPQDFYDHEHATVPPVYAHLFATLDHRLARLVRDAGRGSAGFATSIPDLTRWVRTECPR